MEYKDFFKISGVSKNSNDKDINRAYRQLAHHHQSDKDPGDRKAAEAYRGINERCQALGGHARRSSTIGAGIAVAAGPQNLANTHRIRYQTSAELA